MDADDGQGRVCVGGHAGAAAARGRGGDAQADLRSSDPAHLLSVSAVDERGELPTEHVKVREVASVAQ
eukprot:scaffold19217_cov117-Isochrysis_galbana.AAC.4